MNEVSPADVTLYIPVHNAGRTLAAAIESVRAQHVQPAEFFLVLDLRSGDDSVEIARRSGVCIIEQRHSRLGYARNLAIQACGTRWLASCDSDVTLERDWLARLLPRCGDDVAAVGGCTHERLITPADRWRAVNMPHNWGPLTFDNPFMLVSEMIADVRALRSVGGYLEDLRYFEDSDACQRLRHAGYTLRYEPGAVAWHDRRDTVLDVLNLRWSYAYHRQRIRLENLPGLTAKFAVNRSYCLQSLSQTLHSPQADTCALSLLLWFHHARADLHCALQRWSLLEPAARTACLMELDAATTGCLSGRWADFLAQLDALLPPQAFYGRHGGRPLQSGGRPLRSNAFSDFCGGLAATPGFRAYLAAAGTATRELLDEIPAELGPAVVCSAERLAEGEDRLPFSRPELRVSEADGRRLAEQPRQPAWSWPELSQTLQTAVARFSVGMPVACSGPVADGELPPGADHCPAAGGLALVPHLETSADPRAALRDVLDAADLAVIAYQAPQVFVPAVPILTARDLASECAAAGFQIRHFHTEAGRTRLIVARAQPVELPATPATAVTLA